MKTNQTAFKEFTAEISKVATQLPAETQNQLGIKPGMAQVVQDSCNNPNSMPVKDSVNYIRTEFTLGSTKQKLDLLDPNKQPEIGVTTYDGDKLDDVKNQVVTHISVGYKNDAASNKEAALIYTANFSAQLRNSELVIKQSGDELVRLPMTLFDPRTVGNNSEDRLYTLDKPFTYLGKKPIQMYIDSPAGAGSTDHDYIEVMTYGLQTS